MGCCNDKFSESIAEKKDKSVIIQSKNDAKNSEPQKMINPEANVNLKNSNNDNKIINESLIDKRKIKKNEKKQIIDIKDLQSEPKTNVQNAGIEKDHSEKEIFLFDKIQYAESKNIINLDELEEFESEYDNKDSNNIKDNNDDNILDNQKITSKREIAKLEQKFCINYPEGFSIYNLYELSNQRIAAYGDYILKIYSLKTGRFITEIKLDSIINKITELKNKDILICSNNIIYFYKLLPNKHYGLYKIIDESKQGTYNKRLFSDEEYFDLFSVYELMNGNLLSCSSYGIKIYEKNIDEHYKLSFIKQIDKPITKAVEIKKKFIYFI